MTRPRLLAVVALVVALSACSAQDPPSDDTADSINRSGLEVDGDEPTDPPSPPLRLGTRPDPVPGVVTLDGGSEALTEVALAGFDGTATDVRVAGATSGEDRAFERLCFGEVDVVDSARPLTADEYARCRANGLDVVQLRVAADAVVVAVGSGSDAGTDCLSTDQLRTGFEAGSPVATWADLGDGLGDVPFVAAGPSVDLDVARAFGRDVLDEPEPLASTLRADYHATDTDDATRVFVSGAASDAVLVDTLAVLEPQVTAGRLAPVDARYQRALAARQRLATLTGRVGLFSQGYYATHDRVLRPLEVEASDGDDQRDCVLPDAKSVLDGSYPLSRQLLLTVSTRSLQRPEVGELVGYHLENAVALAERAGVVPLPADEVERQLAWLTDDTFPQFGIGADGLEEKPDEAEPEPSEPPAVEVPAR